jgi:hypothetical protein
MKQDSTRPTLAQFKDACRREFSFLRELGYSEVQDPEPTEPFEVRFSNGELTLSIRGENYGQHAGVRLFHADGREAPPVMFVPWSDRTRRPPFDSTGFSQLDDIRIEALRISRYCRDVLAGDAAKFEAVAKEWRRMTDSKFARSLQKRKLP